MMLSSDRCNKWIEPSHADPYSMIATQLVLYQPGLNLGFWGLTPAFTKAYGAKTGLEECEVLAEPNRR